MKAFVIDRYDRHETGRIGDVPEPQVRDDDVLVRVHAASINVLDAKIRRGEFKRILPYRLPLILGNDFAGTVVRVGSRVRSFKPGDEVYARCNAERIGAFAEFVAVKEGALARKPANLDMAQAAAIPLVALTAWQAFVEMAKLRPGQKVLIHAGSGGVGSIAIQLARNLGAFVATTTSASNAGWVKSLGADVVIDYRTQDFAQELRDYDLVLHSLGDDVLLKSLRVLKPGGRLVSISGPPTPELADNLKLGWPLRQVIRLAIGLLSRRVRQQARARGVGYEFLFMRPSGAQLAEITALIEAGAIKPVVDRIFPLASTADALAYVETGRAKGKVVIEVSQPGMP